MFRVPQKPMRRLALLILFPALPHPLLLLVGPFHSINRALAAHTPEAAAKRARLRTTSTWTTMDYQTPPNSEPSTTAKTFAAGSHGSRKCSSTNSATNGTPNNVIAPVSFASPCVKRFAHTIVRGFSAWVKTTTRRTGSDAKHHRATRRKTLSHDLRHLHGPGRR